MSPIFEGFAVYAGTEIVNTARATAYAGGRAGITIQCNCPTLNTELEDPPYVTPEDDEAPWWDPAQPRQAARFLGVLGLDLQGTNRSTATRSVTELVGGGGAIGPERYGPREILFKAGLIAIDNEAASYGLSWLAAALRGSLAPGCSTDDLCLMASCPPPGGGDRNLRTLLDVATTSPPRVTARKTLLGAVMWEVEWTMVAAVPFIHRPDLVSLGPEDAEKDYVTVPRPVPPPPCDDSTWTILDPACPTPPLPPEPPALRDPCWPESAYRAQRWLWSIPSGLMIDWLDLVPVVEIHSGTGELRRVTVTFFANPVERDCKITIASDSCARCADIAVAYLPPRVALRLDGRTQRAEVERVIGRRSLTAVPPLYGRDGGLFSWPILDCGTGLCVAVMADERTISDGFGAWLRLVPREDAA